MSDSAIIEKCRSYINGFDGKTDLVVGPHMLRQALEEALALLNSRALDLPLTSAEDGPQLVHLAALAQHIANLDSGSKDAAAIRWAIGRLRYLTSAREVTDAARNSALEEAAVIADGEWYQEGENFVTWAWWEPQENGSRGNVHKNDDLAQHSRKIAEVIRERRAKSLPVSSSGSTTAVETERDAHADYIGEQAQLIVRNHLADLARLVAADMHAVPYEAPSFIQPHFAMALRAIAEINRGRLTGLASETYNLAVRALTSEATLASAPQPACVGVGEVEALRALAQDVMSHWPEMAPDGNDIQDYALKHGLLKTVVMDAPCSEECACAGVADFPAECHRRTPLLTGEPSLSPAPSPQAGGENAK